MRIHVQSYQAQGVRAVMSLLPAYINVKEELFDGDRAIPWVKTRIDLRLRRTCVREVCIKPQRANLL